METQDFWTIRVRRIFYVGSEKRTEIITYVPFIEAMFSLELNGPGGGSVTFDLDSDFLQYGTVYEEITEKPNIWEFLIDGNIVAQFVADKFDLTYVSGTGGRAATISGPGLLEAYRRSIIYPPSFRPSIANPSANPTYPLTLSASNTSIFYFAGTNVKKNHFDVWLTILADNRKRAEKTVSLINFVSENFTGSQDSSSVNWKAAPTDFAAAGTAIAPGNDMQAFLTNQADTTHSDFLMVPVQDNKDEYGNFVSLNHTLAKLEVRQDFGVDRTDSVTFFDASMFSKKRLLDTSDLENSVAAIEKGTTPKLHHQMYKPSVDLWGRREKYIDESELTQDMTKSAMQVANNRVYQYRNPITSWTVEIPALSLIKIDDKNYVKCNVAGLDYSVGDYIGIAGEVRRADPKTATPMRVQVLSGRIDSQGNYRAETTLESTSQLTRRLPPGETRSLASFAGYYEKFVPDGSSGTYTPAAGMGSVDYTVNLYGDSHWITYFATGIDADLVEVIVPAPPAPSITSVVIIGTAEVGETLTLSLTTGAILMGDVVFKWLRCDEDGLNCEVIEGATDDSYELTVEDEGFTIKAVAKYLDEDDVESDPAGPVT